MVSYRLWIDISFWDDDYPCYCLLADDWYPHRLVPVIGLCVRYSVRTFGGIAIDNTLLG